MNVNLSTDENVALSAAGTQVSGHSGRKVLFFLPAPIAPIAPIGLAFWRLRVALRSSKVNFTKFGNTDNFLLALFRKLRYQYCDSYHMQCQGAGVCRSHLPSPLFPGDLHFPSTPSAGVMC